MRSGRRYPLRMRWLLQAINPISRYVCFLAARDGTDTGTMVKEFLRDFLLTGFLIVSLNVLFSALIGDFAAIVVATGVAVALVYVLRPWFSRRFLS